VSELPRLTHEELAERLRQQRVTPEILHLDAASCACPSRAVLDAQLSHLRLEAQKGGQVAAAMVQPTIDSLRRSLAGLLEEQTYKVALSANATVGFANLLQHWPFRTGARIGIVKSEYSSNLRALRDRVQRDEVELVHLPQDAQGRVDVSELEGIVDGLDLVTFPHVPSHRGIVQPAAQITRACRRSGVSSIVDVAQSAGYIDLRDVPATAFVGTSRKWLRGPRGVGFVAVANDSPLTDLARLEIDESSFAARMGLARALVELEEAGIQNISARIVWMAAMIRRRLQALTRCTVLEPVEEPSGIVTFRYSGMTAGEVHERLLARGILVSAIPIQRAPLDLVDPVVRAAPHAYSDETDVDLLIETLESLDQPSTAGGATRVS
jgi:pyridoxal 5-phosphate dependent beta-lyase